MPRVAVLAAVVAALAGCEVEAPSTAEPMGPHLVPVRGTVTLDGKPLAGAVVVFLPSFSDSGTHSVGETRADGSYELSHLGQPGTAPGDYRVAISYIVGANGKVAGLAARSAEVVPPELNSGKERIPARYSDLGKTELGASVLLNGPPIDFALEGPLLGPAPSSGPAGPPAKTPDETPKPTSAETAKDAAARR